ncbi:transporter substrate-binding domain-containing protein [Acidisphaera sp. L21]|uniref:transporter substrate-binding domain-containing protein n=1 Tax=Acidisphaera sp. L21 TaxID=1641851 RepID=UPI00131B82D3|nr:transporter substrate-binding domain-containing protein [Acidisphaera sp. L21]
MTLLQHARRVALAAMLAMPGVAAAQTPGVDPAARAALPEALRQSGELKVATSLQWPPFDFKGEDGQPDGLDIRLVRALAAKLGLTPQFTDVKFPAIVPGVTNGRFDIGVDQLNDTAERRKIAQFVNYYNGGYGLLVRKDGAPIDIQHLCGHTLAITQGSAQIGLAEKVSADCQARGEKPIALLYYPNSADTYLAVANGRGEGFLSDEAVGLYIAQHSDKLTMQHGKLEGSTIRAGIVVGLDNTALAAALRLALKSMQQDGSYTKLFEQYGVADSAFNATELNAAP